MPHVADSREIFRAALLAIMFAPTNGNAQTTVVKLNKLADRFVDQQLQYDPTLAYSASLPTRDHSRFADRSPQALSAHDLEERDNLRALLALPIGSLAQQDRATYSNLREHLESDLQLRVCRTELWNVNHFDGWQSQFAEVAERQPAGSAEERKQALQRWYSLPQYLNVEVANLRLGLAQGYSATWPYSWLLVHSPPANPVAGQRDARFPYSRLFGQVDWICKQWPTRY
jgi:uncharacterized protein (DUF885 family)